MKIIEKLIDKMSPITYSLESNHSWTVDDNDWGVMGRAVRVPCLQRLVKSLKHNADMARLIWPMRVVDNHGVIYWVYDPQKDMRLPGCRWRMIKRNAYALWEAAGEPCCDGKEFWLQAEQELKKDNGVYEVDGGYEWLIDEGKQL